MEVLQQSCESHSCDSHVTCPLTLFQECFLLAIFVCSNEMLPPYFPEIFVNSSDYLNYNQTVCVSVCVCVCVHAQPDTMMLKKHTEQMYRQIPYSPYTPGDIAPVCFDPPNWTGVNQHHSSLRPRSVGAYTCNVIILVSEGRWL